METERKVFLTDIHWRTAYYTCKSLARKQIKVIGLKSVDSIYGESRYYSNILAMPAAKLFSNDFFSILEKEATNGDLLIPISTNAIKFLAQKRKNLTTKLLIPPVSIDQMELATDKLQSIEFIKNIGIPIPTTFSTDSLAEAKRLANKIGFPVVIKIREEGNISPNCRYGIARNIEQFKEVYEKLSSIQACPVIQEYIHGKGVGVSVLCENGKILAIFSHQRLREQMIAGGPSTYCSAFDSELLEDYALRFAKASEWTGIAMLEFKFNPAKNTYHFMEINPRFWGSMDLAIKCGVDFPFLLFQWVTNQLNKADIVRKSQSLKLKYLSLDIKAFNQSNRLLSRKERIKSLVSYILEYIDPKLRFGNMGTDWPITLRELSSSVNGFIRMVKDVV